MDHLVLADPRAPGLFTQSRGLAGYRACSQKDATRELSQGIKYGARLVFRGQPDYPKQLSQISDAPPLIWACGDLNLTKRPVTALVGARNASALGWDDGRLELLD